MNERQLTKEEREYAIKDGQSEESLKTAYLCPEAQGYFREGRTGTNGYLLFHDKKRQDNHCGCCGNVLPSDITKDMCCGVGDTTPGPSHALSCENHKPLDLSVPTHVDEAGKNLCVGLINATELIKKGCPRCETEDVNYCPHCQKCVPCGFNNKGKREGSLSY